jgi:septum formation protein
MLLDRLRLPYTVAVPAIDEQALPGECPEETARRLAEAKARAVGPQHPEALIVGSDQVASLGETPINKPGNHAAALAQLLAMRDREVDFHTALCVFDARSGMAAVESVPTRVAFRDYSEAQADRYLRAEQPYDCAGSAKIESMGIALVREVVSTDPTALIGLPLIALVGLLQRFGVDVL